MTQTPPLSGSGSTTPVSASSALTRKQLRELERTSGMSYEDMLAAELEKQMTTLAAPQVENSPEPALALPVEEITQDEQQLPPVVIVEPVVLPNAQSVEHISVPVVAPEKTVSHQTNTDEAVTPVQTLSRRQARAQRKHMVVRHKKAPQSRASAKTPKTKPEPLKRSLSQKLLVSGVLLICGAFALSTSIPANALLSQEDIQRIQMETFFAEQLSLVGQDLDVEENDGATVSAARDNVDVTLAKQGPTSTGSYAGSIFGMDRLETNVPSSSGPIVWPLSSVRISSPYGYRWGELHAGLDMDPPYGTPIMAVADGIVAAVYPAGSSSLGLTVIIDHNVNGVKFSTLYAHMSGANIGAGQTVSAGQVIGAVGNSGNSTGPHLHLEVHVNGTAIDPVPFLRNYAGDAPG